MKDMDQWFLSIASAVLDSGQIGPPKAVMKRLNQVAMDIGWERMKQAAEDMGRQEVVVAINKAEALAADSPELAQLLKGEEGHDALVQWFKEHQGQVTAARDVFLSLLRLHPLEMKLVIRAAAGTNPQWEKLWNETLSPVTGKGGQG